ncbi:MAG: HAD family hydrolase [Candidatus Omnitrophica bacterium]|nr:HAD family hydrolase [Candidatus Omnitrophota bacterium]
MGVKKLFIFDLDGTLADAYGAIERSINFTLKRLGLPLVTYQEVKRKVGRGDRLFMKSFFSAKDMEKALKIYKPHHAKALLKYTRLRPYAKKLLYTLKREKKFLAIASNRPYYYTNIILKALGIKKYFDIVLCADQINSLKPNPKILYTIIKKLGVSKEETVYTGDMDIDMETASRAKVNAIFITGGSSALNSVKKYKNKKVIHSLTEIKIESPI